MVSSPKAWRPALLAAVSGALYGLGFVAYGIWPLIFIFMAPGLWALPENATKKRTFLLGSVFGLVAMMLNYYWIVHLLSSFAGLNIGLAILGYLLLCGYQGASIGVVVLVYQLGRQRKISPYLSLPVGFAAMEFVYPYIFPSFVGNALYEVPILTQFVDITGMLGLSVLIGLVNAACLEALSLWRVRKPQKPELQRFLAVGLTLVVVVIYGGIRISQIDAKSASGKKLKVAMIQTNLGARDKREKRSEFIRRHQEMSKEALRKHPDLELIVWPESAYNRWIAKSATSVRRKVTEGIDAPVIFGSLTWDKGPDGTPRKYNTAIAADKNGEVVGMFDKIELLVFGEKIPFYDTFPQIKKLLPRSSQFTTGTTLKHMRVAGTTLLPMICYEDIIPSMVRDIWKADGPAQALVNITNDSWYGDTAEPLIHLALATFRSIETRRALIRSTNTGISAFVDPVGRLATRSGQWTQEIIVGEVPLVEDRSQTIYMIFGDVLGWVALLLIGLALVFKKRVAQSPE